MGEVLSVANSAFTVWSYFDRKNADQKHWEKSAELQRELARETAEQLDRHHAENLREQRFQGQQNRLTLTEGFNDVAGAIERLEEKEHYESVRFIAEVLNELFFEDDENLPLEEQKAMCRLYFDFHQSSAQKLSFNDVTFTTSWWINRDVVGEIERVVLATTKLEVQARLDKISSLLLMNKELELYWLCKLSWEKAPFFINDSFHNYLYLKMFNISQIMRMI